MSIADYAAHAFATLHESAQELKRIANEKQQTREQQSEEQKQPHPPNGPSARQTKQQRKKQQRKLIKQHKKSMELELKQQYPDQIQQQPSPIVYLSKPMYRINKMKCIHSNCGRPIRVDDECVCPFCGVYLYCSVECRNQDSHPPSLKRPHDVPFSFSSSHHLTCLDIINCYKQSWKQIKHTSKRVILEENNAIQYQSIQSKISTIMQHHFIIQTQASSDAIASCLDHLVRPSCLGNLFRLDWISMTHDAEFVGLWSYICFQYAPCMISLVGPSETTPTTYSIGYDKADWQVCWLCGSQVHTPCIECGLPDECISHPRPRDMCRLTKAGIKRALINVMYICSNPQLAQKSVSLDNLIQKQQQEGYRQEGLLAQEEKEEMEQNQEKEQEGEVEGHPDAKYNDPQREGCIHNQQQQQHMKKRKKNKKNKKK